jgi:hypothetical protein
MLHTWDTSGYRFLVGKPERQDSFEGLGVEKRTILKWIQNKKHGRI